MDQVSLTFNFKIVNVDEFFWLISFTFQNATYRSQYLDLWESFIQDLLS